MPASAPVASDRADVDLYFDVGGGEAVDAGAVCIRFQFKAMMNGGYMILGCLKDANFNIIRRLLIESQYFKLARSSIFRCQFRLKWRGNENRTQLQTAYVISLMASGGNADAAELEFVAIDPPSWFLNAGDASGRVYRGRVSEVIKAVVAQYAPNIVLDVSETVDSTNNMFWMMGMDPKTFISSLLDWSCSLTRNKTQWIVAMDDTLMQIKAQDEIPSRNIGFYVGPHGGAAAPTVREWQILADNALSIVNSKLITQGMSTVSGQYLDKVADVDETKVVVKDSNTSKKYKARTTVNKAFTKPPDGGPPRVGWTNVGAVPEVYSAGEIGRSYSDYIDGRARALWLNMANMIMRCRLRVLGHGIFFGGVGLGVDTITVQWFDIDGQPFFLAGNWIVYGFDHYYRPGSWVTDIYCARLDYNAAGTAVPPQDA